MAQTTDDTEEPVIEMAPFTVTGESYTFGAQKVVLISEENISRLQAVSLTDIFGTTPSVQVGGGHPRAEKIYVRGIEDKLLNISIDGAPQGGYLSHHQGQFTIEPALLRYIEVEPGPGGALQGPGALAGAIRFVTRDATDFLGPDEPAGWFNKASYFSNGDGVRLTTAPYTRIGQHMTVLGSFSWFDVGDYTDGDGNVVDYTGHTQQRAFLKGTGETAEGGHAFSLSYEWIEDEGTFRHRPNFAGWFNHPVAPNDPVNMVFSRETLVASYEQSPADSRRGLSARAYYTDNGVDRREQYEMDYASLGFDLRYGAVYGEDAHSVTYGIDYREDTLGFIGKGSVTGFARTLVYQTIPDENLDIFGVYLQDQWQISEDLEAAFGARFDHYDYTDKDGKSYQDDGISPFAGLSYALTGDLHLNASYGLAFRGPTVIDAITANEGTITNADEIDPEIATNAELGISWRTGPLHLEATVYRQEIDDVIVNSSLDDQDYRGNGGELVVEGYDLTALLALGDFTASAAVSESNPELNGQALNDNSTGLGTSYGRMWAGSLAYQLPSLPISMAWTVQIAERFDDVPDGIPAKAGYVVHGLQLGWNPLDYLTLNLTVNNLFDKAYVDQTTSGYNSQLQRVAGLPAPGRDVRVSLSCDF